MVSKFFAGGNLTALTKDKPDSPHDICLFAVGEAMCPERGCVGGCALGSSILNHQRTQYYIVLSSNSVAEEIDNGMH